MSQDLESSSRQLQLVVVACTVCALFAAKVIKDRFFGDNKKKEQKGEAAVRRLEAKKKFNQEEYEKKFVILKTGSAAATSKEQQQQQQQEEESQCRHCSKDFGMLTWKKTCNGCGLNSLCSECVQPELYCSASSSSSVSSSSPTAASATTAAPKTKENVCFDCVFRCLAAAALPYKQKLEAEENLARSKITLEQEFVEREELARLLLVLVDESSSFAALQRKAVFSEENLARHKIAGEQDLVEREQFTREIVEREELSRLVLVSEIEPCDCKKMLQQNSTALHMLQRRILLSDAEEEMKKTQGDETQDARAKIVSQFETETPLAKAHSEKNCGERKAVCGEEEEARDSLLQDQEYSAFKEQNFRSKAQTLLSRHKKKERAQRNAKIYSDFAAGKTSGYLWKRNTAEALVIGSPVFLLLLGCSVNLSDFRDAL